MLTPEFPYKKNQIILSSDRIMLNSKSDAIFLFGKRMVAIASTETVNIDAKEKVLIDSDKIELGNRAESLGSPVILGDKLISRLSNLLDALELAGSQMGQISATQIPSSFLAIRKAGRVIAKTSANINSILKDKTDIRNPLSSNTYTR